MTQITQPVQLHEKNVIESVLRADPFLHIYGIGDLDEFFWPYTKWFALETSGRFSAIALLYQLPTHATVLGLCRDPEPMRELLHQIAPLLPDHFYAHLSPRVASSLRTRFRLESHGLYKKMGLLDRQPLHDVDTTGVRNLGAPDLDDLLCFYETAYPANWFDPRMLETGQYFGVDDGGVLAGVAGIHVYSERYRVAALGNIATHPDHRGKGYGRKVTAQLCLSLTETTDHIGLNVKHDNIPALSLYKSLGFREIAEYEEFAISVL